MNDLERLQAIQRLLVEAGFATSLDARRERNDAVFSLVVDVGEQTPEEMATLADITSRNHFGFTVENNRAAIRQIAA